MKNPIDPRLLKGTRIAIYISLGIVGLVGLLIAVIGPVLIWNWDEIVLELAKESQVKDATVLIPLAVGLCFTVIMALGLVWVMLSKLLALVRSVSEGSPFTQINAARLRLVGWLMVWIQAVSVPIALLGHEITMAVDPEKMVDGDLGISLNGILGILLVFVLAGVFEQGAAMREELEGTV
jgi:hypothetical protein